jgi:hypothetical protein
VTFLLLYNSLSVPATDLPAPSGYNSAIFCDWTEDGNLLVAAQYVSAGLCAKLLVMNRDGKVLRELVTVQHGNDLHMATWRKYTHQ